jgi:DsbC/DsbD-like thiol-disulfide interchange protein
MNWLSKLAWAGLLLIAAPLLCAAPTISAAVSNPHHTVELRSRDSALAPNQDLTLGVYFKLESGWHIYWQNPGDSGEPPTIVWRLPPGITASSMRFPAPKQIRIGPLMDFGYEGDVLFPIVLHADGSFKVGGHETLAAAVRWLACREVCVPGHQALSVDLPVATAAARVAANARLFSQAQDRLPRPLPAKARARIVSAKDRFLIRLWLGHSASWAVFFPLDADQIDNAAAQQVQPLPDGVQVVVKKDENLRGQPSQIRGLVELGGGRAYDMNAPVVSAVDSELTGSPP